MYFKTASKFSSTILIRNLEKKRYRLQGFHFSPEHISFVGGVPELVIPGE